MDGNKVPQIKSFDCVDHDPIEQWVPSDPNDVDFWMNFSIGMAGEEGADNFQVHVVTRKSSSSSSAVEPKYSVVLEAYSWPALLKAVAAVLESCKGSNWNDISAKLAGKFAWEFDSYTPYKS